MHVWRGSNEERRRTEQHFQGKWVGGKRERKLSLMEQLIAVLTRQRLGLLLDNICERFDISKSYFSRLFKTWIILFEELTSLFPWPSKESIKQFTPPQFSPHPNT